MRMHLVVLAVLAAASAAASSQEGRAPVRLTGGLQTYVVARGDTLRAIGARFGVDVETLAADNGLASRARLSIGQPLRVDNRHLVPAGVEPGLLVINVPQRMAFLDSGAGVEGYPVAVGRRGWQTPIGPFTIVTAEEDPTWDVPASIQEEARRAGKSLPAKVPPGPNNPLGKFWLGLSVDGIGVHGTNAPGSIYGAVTHGCIRMHPDDIARLFPRVAVGSAGRLIYEPVLLAVVGDGIFLEVHQDVYRRVRTDAGADARALASGLGLHEWVDWDAAERVVEARDGIARPVARAGFRGQHPVARASSESLRASDTATVSPAAIRCGPA